MTSPSLSEIRKLVALASFVTQKALLLAGEPFFGTEPADPDAVGRKRSQIDRLCTELAGQLAAYESGPARPWDSSEAAVLKAFGDGLKEIGREAGRLANALAGRSRPDAARLRPLHSLYEASAILAAQAVGAVVERSKLNLRDTVENLRRNQERLAAMEERPEEESLAPFAAPIRNISLQTRRLAKEAAALLAQTIPADIADSPTPRLPGHFKN